MAQRLALGALRIRGSAHWLAMLLGIALIAASASGANADFFSRLFKAAEQTGGRLAQGSASQLDEAALIARKIDPAKGGAALAAHVDQHGTWIFVNRAGERFTAGTPDELSRAIPTLTPAAGEAGQAARLTILLSAGSVFGNPKALAQLPTSAELQLAWRARSYPIAISRDERASHHVGVRPRINVATGDRIAFAEAIWQLERPLLRANIRIVALDPKGAQTLTPLPRLDPASGQALADMIVPDRLAGQLAVLRRQTAILIGRVAGDRLYFRAGDASERSVSLVEIRHAAKLADANLLVLQSEVPRQPGVRNWLWQRASVSGLDDALKSATLADFLNAVAASNGSVLRFSITSTGGGRVAFLAEPEASGLQVPTFGMDKVMVEVLAEIGGQVAATTVQGDYRDANRQRELDLRFLASIPSDYQIGYILAMIAGLIGLGPLRTWWRRVWPAEVRMEYSGPLGYGLARLLRSACFLLVFMPVAGVPAAVVALAGQMVGLLLLPFRAVSWIIARLGAHRA